MKMGWVKARFIGADGSLGYRHGETYHLWVGRSRRYPVVIRRIRGGGLCPYSSEAAFRRNWELAQKVL